VEIRILLTVDHRPAAKISLLLEAVDMDGICQHPAVKTMVGCA
jgi:hypothetical protein